ncbi:MAG: dihydroneopterin aldolase [Bacteroidetes bacterium]|nr:dihydroneopterin aldolase [Bacteroidota bacterium]
MSIISIEGMEFFAYHGCFKEEQIIGTKFIVDLFIETETSLAEETDDLTKTINYLEVYSIVKKEMEIKSKLLENAGRRILSSLKHNFPNTKNMTVKISKLNPPLGGKIKNVSLTIKL